MTDVGNFKMVAKTFFGLENVLAQELEGLGATDVQKENRAVSFSGDKKILYKANYCLRTAVKVLKPIHHFSAKNEVELYQSIDDLDWTLYLERGDTLVVDTVLHSEHFGHSQFISQKVKDAVVDQLRKKTGRRPSVDTKNPTLRLHMHINDDKCTLSLDSSGESLHKRGYRSDGHVAPINEILAAGMILLSGWDRKSDFYDLMCGSGTIPIEAALIAFNVAPGVFRSDYAFTKWNDYDDELFQQVYDEQPEVQFSGRIFASDYSAKAVSLARLNAKNAFLEKKINFSVQSMFDVRPESKGTLVINPPYGERLGGGNMMHLYKQIGDTLKKQFSGFNAWIISSNREALKSVGLRTKKKITLFNANLECRFNKYEMYQGSQKQKHRYNSKNMADSSQKKKNTNE